LRAKVNLKNTSTINLTFFSKNFDHKVKIDTKIDQKSTNEPFKEFDEHSEEEKVQITPQQNKIQEEPSWNQNFDDQSDLRKRKSNNNRVS